MQAFRNLKNQVEGLTQLLHVCVGVFVGWVGCGGVARGPRSYTGPGSLVMEAQLEVGGRPPASPAPPAFHRAPQVLLLLLAICEHSSD